MDDAEGVARRPDLVQRGPAPRSPLQLVGLVHRNRDILASMHQEERPIERLRRLCLALPEAVEKEAWGDPTFRVRDKIFAMEKRGDGRCSLWAKASPGAQEHLVAADPQRFFVPPYVGPKGWVGIRLTRRPDWAEVGLLVRRSYRLVAPRRLAAEVED